MHLMEMPLINYDVCCLTMLSKCSLLNKLVLNFRACTYITEKGFSSLVSLVQSETLQTLILDCTGTPGMTNSALKSLLTAKQPAVTNRFSLYIAKCQNVDYTPIEGVGIVSYRQLDWPNCPCGDFSH